MQNLTLTFIIHLLMNEKSDIIKKQTENIRKSIDQFPWAMRFTNIDVNKKVNLFNKTINHIILNPIPHETITCDDRNPPWINKDIKELIHEKNTAHKT